MGFWDGAGAAILTGGMSLLGGFTSAKSASSGVESMNAANAAEAEKNRQFQLYMSNTAHTREVADLRNAGLNPILSATGGSGASSPGGSMAVMQNTKEQSSNILANTAKAVSDTILNTASASIARNQARVAKVEAELAEAGKKDKLAAQASQAELDKNRAAVNSKMVWADAVGSRIGKVLDAISPFVPYAMPRLSKTSAKADVTVKKR